METAPVARDAAIGESRAEPEEDDQISKYKHDTLLTLERIFERSRQFSRSDLLSEVNSTAARRCLRGAERPLTGAPPP